MRPVSQPFWQISLGKIPSSSSWPATGMISLRVNSRAVSISCCCSSVKSKLGIGRRSAAPPLAANQPVPLKGGETLSVGNFSFLFHTADSFVAYLRHVVKI